MTEELRLAASEFCNRMYASRVDDPAYRERKFFGEDVVDAFLAGVAAVAVQPADDAEPVTEARLRAAGFTGEDQYRVATGPARTPGQVQLCFGFAPIAGDTENPRAWLQYTHDLGGWVGLEVANVPIPMPATMGDVRRLCAALGIALPATATPVESPR